MGSVSKGFALILILVMAISSLSVLMVKPASADLTIYPWDIVYKAPPIITVNSPSNNSILYANYVQLNFTFTQLTGLWLMQYVNSGNITKQMLTGVGYVLDGESYTSFPTSNDLSTPFNYSTNITLGEGLHTLQVYGNASYIIDGNNVDHYPLLSQADIIIPVFTLSPTGTATLSPTSTATSTVPEFPVLIIPFFIILIASALLLVYFKKHKH